MPVQAQPDLHGGARPPTSNTNQQPALVPTPTGFTVAAPVVTWSPMPSLGQWDTSGDVAAASAPNTRGDVGLVLDAQPPADGRAGGVGGHRLPASERGVVELEGGAVVDHPQLGAVLGVAPRPDVAEPQLRDQVQRSGAVPVVAGGDAQAEVVGVGLGVVRPRPRRSGRRRTRRCRAARTRARRSPAGRSRPAGRRRGTPPGGSGSATAARRGWARRRGTSSTPSRPRRGCPPCRPRPKRRSLRMGSWPFHSARPRQSPWRRSHTPGQAVLHPAVGPRAGVVERERRPTPRHRRCSPRGPSPTSARPGTAPTRRQRSASGPAMRSCSAVTGGGLADRGGRRRARRRRRCVELDVVVLELGVVVVGGAAVVVVGPTVVVVGLAVVVVLARGVRRHRGGGWRGVRLVARGQEHGRRRRRAPG